MAQGSSSRKPLADLGNDNGRTRLANSAFTSISSRTRSSSQSKGDRKLPPRQQTLVSESKQGKSSSSSGDQSPIASKLPRNGGNEEEESSDDERCGGGQKSFVANRGKKTDEINLVGEQPPRSPKKKSNKSTDDAELISLGEQANKIYRELTEANEERFPESKLTSMRNNDLWDRKEGTDASGMFKQGKGKHDYNKYLPQYCRAKKESKNASKIVWFEIEQSSTFKGRISLALGLPAAQGDAEDNKMLIDLGYIIFTTFSKGELESMGGDGLRAALIRAHPYLENQVLSPTGKKDRAWGAQRSRFEHRIYEQSCELAKAVVQCRQKYGVSHETTVSNFLQRSVSDLIQNNESKMVPLIDVMERSIQVNPQARPSAQEIRGTRLRLDMLLGGPSRGLSLEEDLGLSPDEINRIHPVHDMILFSNTKSLPGNGSQFWTRDLIPFFNEKTIALYVMMREIHKRFSNNTSAFGWNKVADGEHIKKILGDGSLHRIEYNFDSQTGKLTGYRLAKSYTSDDIIPLCDRNRKKSYIYLHYRNCFIKSTKKIWDIE